jgi:hypothetical protein
MVRSSVNKGAGGRKNFTCLQIRALCSEWVRKAAPEGSLGTYHGLDILCSPLLAGSAPHDPPVRCGAAMGEALWSDDANDDFTAPPVLWHF